MRINYPPGLYDDETLNTLEQVFRDVWKTVETDGAPPERQDLVRDKVTQILLRLVDQGIRDQDVLRTETLERIGTLKRNGFPLLAAAVLVL